MPKQSVAQLKERIHCLEYDLNYYKSLCESFETGNIPDYATLKHFIYAQYGRMRLEKVKKTPALLVKM